MYFPVKVGKLSDNQIKKLVKGQGIRVKKGVDNVIHLSEQQIKKLERAAKKGMGCTVTMDPYQSSMHKSGGALGSAFKNLGRATKQDFNKLSSDVKGVAQKTKRGFNKTFNKELGNDIVDGLKIAGLHAIEQGIPIATSVASMALGDPTGMSGNALGNVASEYASDAYKRDVMKGKGLFKTLHKVGIPLKKKALVKGLKQTASVVASTGSQLVGDVVSMYAGPMVGQKFAEMSNNVAQSAIQNNLKKGLRDAGKATKNEAMRFAIEAVDDQIDKNLTGNQKRLAQNLVANKYGSARDLVYDMSEMYTGTGMKLKKRVGRPRKSKGGALYPAGYGK